MRILNLEDNPKDSELLEAMLATAGIACELVRVENSTDFMSALDQQAFDLIVSDYSLPSYDGLSALVSARTKCPEVPFIFFSGTIGEEFAVEAMKFGATDFVPKQRSARLVPAVQRAIREVEERRTRLQAEEELRRTERQLRQSQKMEAVGRLAGGVAHDFNNLLTIILGECDLNLDKITPDNPMRSSFEEIRKAGERAAMLTAQLLLFSRKQLFKPTTFSLNEIMNGMSSMLRRLIGEDVELKMHPASDLGLVTADQGQIEQVLVNLVVNARDAMPHGGTIIIESANVELGEDYAATRADVHPGEYVMLAVSDTGTGMSDEVKTHLFEPFFTTKEQGKGTGLGLATSYGIAKQFGGHIGVYSEVGTGTTMRLYLPRTVRVGDAKPSSVAEANSRGDETILIVEDEARVREIASKMLSARGYKVLTAADGHEALRLLGETPDTVHLMLTDVVMPKMGGRELAERVRALRPGIKVLFASGYTDDVILQHRLKQHDIALVNKPYTAESLSRKVRETLDQAPGVSTRGPSTPPEPLKE